MFARLIDSKDTTSSKRFLGLIVSAFFILASIFILIIPVPDVNVVLVDRVLLYSMIIILMSLFGLNIDKVADMLINISKTQGAAKVLTGSVKNRWINDDNWSEEDGDYNQEVLNNKKEPLIKNEDDLENIRKKLIDNLSEQE